VEFILYTRRNARSAYDLIVNDLSYGFKEQKCLGTPLTLYFMHKDQLEQIVIFIELTRRIFSEKLTPLTDIAQGQSQVINTLDLSYYPSERVLIIIVQTSLLAPRIILEG
jgi:hypothetical protein